MNKVLTAPPTARPTGVAQFDAGMEVRPASTLTSGWDWLRGMLLVHARQTESSGEGHQPSRPEEKCCKSEASEVEPAGIEPATSCLQSRSDCPPLSPGVPKIPANAAFLLATGGHERTARDKLVPPWCPLSVRDLGRREEGSPRLARLCQLEDAAAAKAALASAIAVCASSRGISSNSSITWP
jgi:hypothetical protein